MFFTFYEYYDTSTILVRSPTTSYTEFRNLWDTARFACRMPAGSLQCVTSWSEIQP